MGKGVVGLRFRAMAFAGAAVVAVTASACQTVPYGIPGPGPSIELVVKDTGGKPELALARASEATDEGSSAVLGPIFARR
jgi:ABC-type branched-subunit amino acid transport system substrate-binding protein